MSNNFITGIYPGTFDPVTFGHIDIIERASHIVNKLIISVAENKHKKPFFDMSERIKMIEAQARKVLPSLTKVKNDWIGFRPTLPDSLPVIGHSLKTKRILYAFGHQHLGLTLGPLTGEIVAAMVNDTSAAHDLSPFDIERFQPKRRQA